jgi:nucleotide-binding universal stress UspA family protein
MFSRILVGVNGSEHAARALAVAIDLAVAERGRLTLISAVPHPSPWAWGGPVSLDQLRRDSERYHYAMLRKAAEAVPAQVPTTLLVRHGRAADRLLAELRRDHYDLIVVGSGNRSRLRSALFGGLGPALERKSQVPVVVIPAPTTDARGGARGRRREHRLLPAKRVHRHGSAAA